MTTATSAELAASFYRRLLTTDPIEGDSEQLADCYRLVVGLNDHALLILVGSLVGTIHTMHTNDPDADWDEFVAGTADRIAATGESDD